jgi:DNA polymerase
MSNTASGAPRVTALQRAWLRELGVDRIWAAAGATTAAPSAADTAAATAGGAAAVANAPAVPTANVGNAATAATAAPAAQAPPVPSPAAPVAQAVHASPPPAPAVARVAIAAPPGPIGQVAAVPTAATPADLALLDLDTLRERVLACTACGLCKGRRQAVFGTGAAATTRWLVVGEAPGEQEDRQGEPFVGRSGQLLDAMLASVGMSRAENVFIANVIKCRPPGNRNPKPEEIAACAPYLMRQIALLEPERILVLGRFAAQALLGTDATIGSLRGRVHALRMEDREIPVVVSYHPAYLLRSPSEKARSWQDLRMAAAL